MKVCSKCKIKKSLDCFGKDVTMKTGLKSRCKECLSEEGRLRRAGLFRTSRVYIRANDPEAICRRCGQLKPIEEFSRAKHSPSGYHRTCKVCRTIEERESRERNPDQTRRRNLKANYNLSLEDWDFKLLLQKNRCDCCKLVFIELRGKKGPFVDHDHSCCPGKKSCGKCIRGLICFNCNMIIGLIERNLWPVEVPAITKYLEKYSTLGGGLCALVDKEKSR